MPYTVLMPVFAGRGAAAAARTPSGFLMAASGVGALLGALYLASRRTRARARAASSSIARRAVRRGPGRLLALARRCWLSLPLMVVTGVGMMVQMAASNTVLQTHRRRGQARPRDELLHDGLLRHGAVRQPAGRRARRAASARPHTLLLGGAVCILAAPGFARQLPRLRELVRPIYVELGILPAMAAEGIQHATQFTVPPER